MKRSRFVIHEHHATNLHFDLRLEIGGVLKSWAVPKGVSMNPADKRLAIAVPDHSLSYIDYEGTIREGSYGAGKVVIWDRGHFETDNAEASWQKGRLLIAFFGGKLRGGFSLIKMSGANENWLIIKAADEFADHSWRLETVLEPRPRRQSKKSKKTVWTKPE
jgi:bifunctional non-homologous end joining protein LigD